MYISWNNCNIHCVSKNAHLFIFQITLSKINLKNDFSGFPKVKWLQYTGKVGKCTSCLCQIFSGFNTPKIIKIG